MLEAVQQGEAVDQRGEAVDLEVVSMIEAVFGEEELTLTLMSTLTLTCSAVVYKSIK